MEKVIIEAKEAWAAYGRAINKAFHFHNFLIEGQTLENMINTADPDKIKKFIEFIKKQIALLESAE